MCGHLVTVVSIIICHCEKTITRFTQGNFVLQSTSKIAKLSSQCGNGASLKRFQCTLCSKRFTTHLGFKLHEGSHRGVFPYKCSYCGKGFLASSNLRGHLVDHTGVMEFSCSVCKREFRYAKDLKLHQKRCQQQAETRWRVYK